MFFRLIVFLIFNGIILLPLFYRYILFFNPPVAVQFTFLGILFLFGLLPMGANERFEKNFKSFYPLWRTILYAIYIGGILLLFLTFVRDLFWIAVAFIFSQVPSPFDIGPVMYANSLTLTVVIVLILWSLVEGNRLPRLRHIPFYSPKITDPIRLIVLTDLHLHRTTPIRRIQKIIDQVNTLKPDIVLLVGDTIDDEPTRLTALLALFKTVSASGGMYFVTGNHEFYIGYAVCVRALSDMGAVLLDNKGVLLKSNLFLGGIPDSECGPKFSNKPNFNKAFQNADSHMFRLLLSHTPIRFKKNAPCDLEISGHTHGGQIFPFHVAPFLRYKCVAGFYRMGNAWLYVSRGTGQWGPQMRLFAPTEITCITLCPCNRKLPLS